MQFANHEALKGRSETEFSWPLLKAWRPSLVSEHCPVPRPAIQCSDDLQHEAAQQIAMLKAATAADVAMIDVRLRSVKGVCQSQAVQLEIEKLLSYAICPVCENPHKDVVCLVPACGHMVCESCHAKFKNPRCMVCGIEQPAIRVTSQTDFYRALARLHGAMRQGVAEVLPGALPAPAASALRNGPKPDLSTEEKATGLHRQFCSFTFSIIRDSILWQLAQIKPALVASTYKLVWKRTWGSGPFTQKHINNQLADIGVTLDKIEFGPPAGGDHSVTVTLSPEVHRTLAVFTTSALVPNSIKAGDAIKTPPPPSSDKTSVDNSSSSSLNNSSSSSSSSSNSSSSSSSSSSNSATGLRSGRGPGPALGDDPSHPLYGQLAYITECASWWQHFNTLSKTDKSHLPGLHALVQLAGSATDMVRARESIDAAMAWIETWKVSYLLPTGAA